MAGNVKLMTSAGGGVVLDTATTTATDVTVKVPVTGVNNGTLVCSDSSGNVGIGTSSPAGKLSLYGGDFYLQNSDSGQAGNDGLRVYLDTSESNSANLRLYESSAMKFYTGNVERMRIDSSGNVGIGTSSPTFTNGGGLQLKRSTKPTLRITENTSTGFDLIQDANDAYLWNRDNGAMLFGTNNTERMRIDSSGNLLVGKTGQSATTVGFEARPNGEVSLGATASTNGSATVWNTYSTGAAAWRFYVGMGGTVYATNTTISAISDRRYKENIRDLDAGLNEVLALKPRVFDWKEGKGKDIKNDRGFIAQEFEQVFPDLIDEWKDPAPEGEEPYKSVRQDLIPVLVKAIQELSAKNDALEARIAALEAK